MTANSDQERNVGCREAGQAELETLPLNGVRVLDLSRVLAGPVCSMMLGDLGADVIKVERPGTGDDTRGWGPPFDERGESAYFLSCNRNKRSLAADLTRGEDQRLITSLARTADVVLDNFLPGTLSRYNIDAASMLAEDPRLLWCSVGGYPDDPQRPGYDFAAQAEYGWMSITGDPAGQPMKSAVALIDVLTGKDACIAILAALIGRRERPAPERHLRVTLGQTALAALVNVAQNALVTGHEARRWGNAHANLVPYQLFETGDRPIVIAVGTDGQWRALVDVLDDAALRDDLALVTNAGRVTNRGRCVAGIQRVLRTRTAAQWKIRCEAAGVPVGEVRTVLEALADIDASPLTGVPSSVGGRIRRPPPLLGEHSHEIRERGWL
ncbi:MAG TPA: CoA transferase [Gemmatimonadaceae bacterium]|nr:CoA transferase [Gemmatimonadaceae bacterium]